MVTLEGLEVTKRPIISETVIEIFCNNVGAHPDENPVVIGKVNTPYFTGTNLIVPGPISDRLKLLADDHVRAYPKCSGRISYNGGKQPSAFIMPK